MEQGLKEPFIEETGDFFVVRFFRNNNFGNSEVSESTGKVLGKKYITNQEEIIYQYLVKNGSIKKIDVENILNVKDSRARKILEKMIKNEVLLKRGQGRSTYYVLADEK